MDETVDGVITEEISECCGNAETAERETSEEEVYYEEEK